MEFDFGGIALGICGVAMTCQGLVKDLLFILNTLSRFLFVRVFSVLVSVHERLVIRVLHCFARIDVKVSPWSLWCCFLVWCWYLLENGSGV